MGGVAGRGFALVGVLLFLIQNDEADVLQRREHRAAGAHHNVGVALLDHPPLEQPLGIVEGGMLYRQPAAEGGFEASDHLGRQTDLRHQHQCPAAHGQRFLDEPQKHHRLAAAGDPVQQRRVGLPVPQVGQQRVKDLLLFRGEGHWPGVKGNVREEIQRFELFLRFDNAFLAERVQRGLADAQQFQRFLGERPIPQGLHRRKLARAGLGLFGQVSHKGVAALGGAGQAALHAGTPVFAPRLVLRPVGDDRLDRLEPGAEGAFLQELHQLQQVRRQAGVLRRGVQQGFAAGVGGFLLPHRQHHRHAGVVAPAKGHQHHAARPDAAHQLRRNEIGIQLIKMDGGVIHRHLRGVCHSSFPWASLNWMMEYRLSAQVSTCTLTTCSS